MRSSAPSPSAGRDPLDSAIVALLGEDGRLSNREIGRRIGISEFAARSRIKRMRADGTLQYFLLIDGSITAKLAGAYIAISVEQKRLRPVAEEIGALPGCSFCGLATGQFNVMAYFLTVSRDRLYAIIRNEVETLSGVLSVSVREVLTVAKHPLQMN